MLSLCCNLKSAAWLGEALQKEGDTRGAKYSPALYFSTVIGSLVAKTMKGTRYHSWWELEKDPPPPSHSLPYPPFLFVFFLSGQSFDLVHWARGRLRWMYADYMLAENSHKIQSVFCLFLFLPHEHLNRQPDTVSWARDETNWRTEDRTRHISTLFPDARKHSELHPDSRCSLSPLTLKQLQKAIQWISSWTGLSKSGIPRPQKTLQGFKQY